VTRTSTVPATVPAAARGLVAVQLVVLLQRTWEAALAPNCTVVAPAAVLKPLPLIVTTVPPWGVPLVGLIAVITGLVVAGAGVGVGVVGVAVAGTVTVGVLVGVEVGVVVAVLVGAGVGVLVVLPLATGPRSLCWLANVAAAARSIAIPSLVRPGNSDQPQFPA
jgi:hypothetical protein